MSTPDSERTFTLGSLTAIALMCLLGFPACGESTSSDPDSVDAGSVDVRDEVSEADAAPSDAADEEMDAAPADVARVDADTAQSDADASRSDAGSARRPAILDGPLSETGWFEGSLEELSPVDALVPFDVAVPFFSDHVDKQRYIIVPEGEGLPVAADGTITNWPSGTIFVKVMADDDTTDLPWLEVRALVRGEARWWMGTWTWDPGAADGQPLVDGAELTRLHPVDPDAGQVAYPVPTVAECERCHGGNDPEPLGFVAAQLDHAGDPGAASLVAAGVLSAPMQAERRLVDPYSDAPLEQRARTWLAVNCASCHARGEAGARRGLILTLEASTDAELGICRYETLAAPTPDDVYWLVAPGEPEASALYYRSVTLEDRARMPDVPYATVDEHGVELVRQWIREMSDTPCDQR